MASNLDCETSTHFSSEVAWPSFGTVTVRIFWSYDLFAPAAARLHVDQDLVPRPVELRRQRLQLRALLRERRGVGVQLLGGGEQRADIQPGDIARGGLPPRGGGRLPQRVVASAMVWRSAVEARLEIAALLRPVGLAPSAPRR